MLELAGENVFKVRAYDAGARALRGFPGDLAEAVRTRELLKVRGIGSGLFANIETLVTTGSLPYYDELRASFPPGCESACGSRASEPARRRSSTNGSASILSRRSRARVARASWPG